MAIGHVNRSVAQGPSRRYGKELEQAIYDAVLIELAEVGFGRLTFESIAARAGTGKGPIYRRWSTTTELVIDTLSATQFAQRPFVPTGALRTDLIELTRLMTRHMETPKGNAIRSLIGEAHHYPELLATVHQRILQPGFDSLTKLLCDAADRGEVSREALTPYVLEVLHALIFERYLLHQARITRAAITNMIDEVLLPLVAVTPTTRR